MPSIGNAMGLGRAGGAVMDTVVSGGRRAWISMQLEHSNDGRVKRDVRKSFLAEGPLRHAGLTFQRWEGSEYALDPLYSPEHPHDCL
jgi:hypothetical protein